MQLRGLIDESFIEYKKPSMVLIFPTCTFKCDRECGRAICQNGTLVKEPIINISSRYLVERFMGNPLTSSVVCAGLEPFDSWEELQGFILELRYRSNCDIIIYTGYKEEEISQDKKDWLKLYDMDGPIIIKYGRFIPNQESHFDTILGVELASLNQYARRIGDEN